LNKFCIKPTAWLCDELKVKRFNKALNYLLLSRSLNNKDYVDEKQFVSGGGCAFSFSFFS